MTGEERLKEKGTLALGKEVQGEFTMKDKRKWMDKRVRDREGEMLQVMHFCFLSTFTAHPQLTILMALIFMINSLALSPLARPLEKYIHLYFVHLVSGYVIGRKMCSQQVIITK